MKKRVGDTLVEVALAIGIFSMVAIAVVAVMTSGTSSSQTALETTLTREEIDIQAEALRFIHSSYLANPDATANPYAALWKKITAKAINPASNSSYVDYSPSTCQSVLDSNTLKSNGFVIDLHALSTDPKNAYYGYSNHKNNFTVASTYPRLLYSQKQVQGNDTLIDSTITANLSRVEGIYVIAVADRSTTQIVGPTNQATGQLGFYDFYIRTCWYGAGDNSPSTISTVIRLYNPPNI